MHLNIVAEAIFISLKSTGCLLDTLVISLLMSSSAPNQFSLESRGANAQVVPLLALSLHGRGASHQSYTINNGIVR
jgi:hypothetical protein